VSLFVLNEKNSGKERIQNTNTIKLTFH